MACRAALLIALFAVVGCQATPARVACYASFEDAPKREMAFARNVVEDSIETVAKRPFASAGRFIIGTARFVRSGNEQFFCKTIGMRLAGEPPPVRECGPTLDPVKFEAELRKSTGNELKPARVDLHINHAHALAALEAVIDGATCRLDIIMFQWDNDERGWDIARKVAAKAGPGLPVRILIDGGGNLLYGKPKEDSPANLNAVVCWLAKQPHVEVIRSRVPLGRLDHRKLVLANSRVAWAGGRNITIDEFTTRHDLAYTVTGPIIRDMCAEFDSSWQGAGGKSCRGEIPDEPVSPNSTVRIVTAGLGDSTFQHAIYLAVDSAYHHIYLQNPYLTDGPLIAKLAQARQRGVDVRVVMTVQTGQKLFDGGNRVTANRLRDAGVRVYIFPGMTHIKAAVVDRAWAYTGSGNFDPHSLRVNRESGLSISEGALIGEIEDRVFGRDFKPEWELRAPLPVRPRDYLYEWLGNLIL